MNKIVFSTNELLEKYCENIDHANEAVKYSNMIFDAINGTICVFSDREKEYLIEAAKLHDIGYARDKKSHHKHTMKMIIEEGLQGYSEDETKIIANIARYHRSSLPNKEKHEEYAKLDKEQRKLVKKLASILKIADGFDKPHKNLILRIRAVETAEAVNFYLKTVGYKPKLEMAEKKKDLFENTFEKPLNFLFE